MIEEEMYRCLVALDFINAAPIVSVISPHQQHVLWSPKKDQLAQISV